MTSDRTTKIKVGRESWEVPFGFGAEYKQAAYDPDAIKPTTIADMLGLIGYSVAELTIRAWPLRKRVEAIVYARNVHLRASDNPIQAHARLEWLPAPWESPAGTEIRS